MSISYYFISVVSKAIDIYVWLIIARVVVSFFQPRQYHPVLKFIYEVTEPVLAFCRRILPAPKIGLDFSPILAVVGLELVKSVIIRLHNLVF